MNMLQIFIRSISIAMIYASIGTMLFAAAYDFCRDPPRFIPT